MKNTDEVKNPKANSILGMYTDEPIGMDHPIFMARFQSRIDAGFLFQNGLPLKDAITATLERMHYLFGDDFPDDIVRTTVTLEYAECAAEQLRQNVATLMSIFRKGGEDAAIAEFSKMIKGTERAEGDLLRAEFMKALKPEDDTSRRLHIISVEKNHFGKEEVIRKYPQIWVAGPIPCGMSIPPYSSKQDLLAQVVQRVMDRKLRAHIVWSKSETIFIEPAKWRSVIGKKYPHIMVYGTTECALFYPDTITREELIARGVEIVATQHRRVCVAWTATDSFWPAPPQLDVVW